MDKEVRFNQKRVDESWKEKVAQSKSDNITDPADSFPLSFASFVTSLGIQALIKLGDLKIPNAEKTELDLEGARETIDLLLILKDKTRGNLTSEEETLLASLIADLQMKFVQQKVENRKPS